MTMAEPRPLNPDFVEAGKRAAEKEAAIEALTAPAKGRSMVEVLTAPKSEI